MSYTKRIVSDNFCIKHENPIQYKKYTGLRLISFYKHLLVAFVINHQLLNNRLQQQQLSFTKIYF